MNKIFILTEKNYIQTTNKCINTIKYYKVASTGCWHCISHKIGNKGYPILKRRGVCHDVHRYVWTLINGPILRDIIVLHKCDNKVCINPDHLELGSIQDNMKDARDRDAYKNMRVLSSEDVFKIRSSSFRGVALAKTFKVSPQMISLIRLNKVRLEE